jgi:MoaA/NifB/PqqE/SkfB family radical SAM enzyme
MIAARTAKIGVAIACAEAPCGTVFRQFSEIAGRLINQFHPNSTMFWLEGRDEAAVLTSLIETGLLEDQRVYLDGLCLTVERGGEFAIDLAACCAFAAVDRSVVVVPVASADGTAASVLGLPVAALRALAQRVDGVAWCHAHDQAPGMASLVGHLRALGYPPFELSAQDRARWEIVAESGVPPVRPQRAVSFMPAVWSFVPRDGRQPAQVDVSEGTPAGPSAAPAARTRAAAASGIPTTRERTLTRRGVLYVGQQCNARCVFCYYAFADDRRWGDLDELKTVAGQYRDEFDNTAVDLTGGEPTVYPGVLDLALHCSSIGLRPSIITNGLALADAGRLARLAEAGVYDFLVSVHALGDTYSELTGVPNGWRRLDAALDNLQAGGYRWRLNCTMTVANLAQLPDIARLAVGRGARVVNFISYNPFYEWGTKTDIDFQARHSDIAPSLSEALDVCAAGGLEANVRYLPFCQMKGHEANCYNYGQLSYDPREWDMCSWFSERAGNPASRMPAYVKTLVRSEAERHAFYVSRTRAISYTRGEACGHCALGPICDGLTNQYARRFGTAELAPYGGSVVTDPTRFIAEQEKVVDC